MTRHQTPQVRPTEELSDDIGLQEKLLDVMLNAKSDQELRVQAQALARIIDSEIKRSQALHDRRIEVLQQHHQHRMELLQYITPILSGAIFAVLGVLLLRDQDTTIKYFGIASFSIGACALIPGVSKTFRAIAEIMKGFRELADSAKKMAALAVAKEEDGK